MRTINIHQAKTHLSRLVDEAVQGDSFVIAKRGKGLVQVIRLGAPEAPAKRRLGFMKGCTPFRTTLKRLTGSWIKKSRS